MDGAITTRKYPAYSTQQLKEFVAAGQGTDVMLKEIADCEAGLSSVRAIPQLLGGKIVIPGNKKGRL